MQDAITIVKYHAGRLTEIEGTLEELVERFSYKLRAGHAYNPDIPVEPESAQELVDALNAAVAELDCSGLDPDSYELG